MKHCFKYIFLLLVALLVPILNAGLAVLFSEHINSSLYISLYLFVYVTFFLMVAFILKSKAFVFSIACAIYFFIFRWIELSGWTNDFYYVVSLFLPFLALIFFSSLKFSVRLAFFVLAILSVFIAFQLLSYPSEDSLSSFKQCFYLSGEAERFYELAENRGVAYKRISNCFYFERLSPNQSTLVRSIKNEIKNQRPPPGRSESWGDRNHEVRDLLMFHGIAVDKAYYNGVEFLTWSKEDAAKVEELLEFPAWKKEAFKRARDEGEMGGK